MSQSDDVAARLAELYVITGDPMARASTYVTTGTPTSDWDEKDTAVIGKKFSIGSIVQNSLTKIIYWCSDATEKHAVWYIMVLQEM